MSILVTGGLGVMGSFVARELVLAGERPVLLDTAEQSTRLAADVVGSTDLVRGSILDRESLAEVLRRFEVTHIIHTAAHIDPQLGGNIEATVQVNIVGTLNVFEAARQAGVRRVVWCSTRGVYREALPVGQDSAASPITEDHPQIQSGKGYSTLYDATKQFCEHLMVKYVRDGAMDIVALRFASTYGPGKTIHHGAVSIVSRMIEDALRGLPVVIEHGGDQQNDFIYNRDSARALIQAAQATGLRDRVFHVGAGRGLTLRDFARAIAGHIPGARIEVGPGLDYLRMGRQSYAVFDTTRAREQLGFEVKYPPDEAVADYIALVRRLGLLEE